MGYLRGVMQSLRETFKLSIMKLNLNSNILLIGAGLTLAGPIPGIINLFLTDPFLLNERFYIFLAQLYAFTQYSVLIIYFKMRIVFGLYLL